MGKDDIRRSIRGCDSGRIDGAGLGGGRFLYLRQAEAGAVVEAGAAVQFAQFQDEQDGGDVGVQPLNQFAGGVGGAAGGQHVVDQHHPVARPARVGVDLQRVGAVLQGIVLANGPVRQLARLADQRQRQVEPLGERRAEQEAAALDAGDPVGAPRGALLGEPGHDARQQAAGGEQRGDVAEQDAGLGKVGHRP